MYSTLIATEDLNALLGGGALSVVDCRFDLSDTAAGRAAYREAHIPRAVYADLDVDLSGPPSSDHGRHPLPPPARMIETFRNLGISNSDQVVVYDDAGGMVAARAWWMLRYMGHDAVAVLNGGWQAWLEHALPAETGEPQTERGLFSGSARRSRLVVLDEVAGAHHLVDSREPQRYRGDVEPLDPRAGHIPGARNRYFKDNLNADGFFLTPALLGEAFAATLGTLPDSDTVYYCGSGVSACHNILAHVHAGLSEPRLYCGSWSEWCADPDRSCVRGDEQ